MSDQTAGTLIEELKEATQRYSKAREEYMKAAIEHRKAKAWLKELEANLLIEGSVTGKNAQEREASLMALTSDKRDQVLAAEHMLSKASAKLDIASEELKTVRAAMNFLAAKEGGK